MVMVKKGRDGGRKREREREKAREKGAGVSRWVGTKTDGDIERGEEET